MSSLSGLFNRLLGVNAELEAWKENDPEGYQAALKEERDEYLHVVDAVRHEQGLEPLNAQQRAEYHTSDDPYKIQEMRINAVESLGDDGREWLKNQGLVADNIGYAQCMKNIGQDEFTDLSTIEEAIAGTKQLCDKFDIDPTEVAERYGIELDPDIRDKLTGTAAEADNTVERNMPPPEYVASVDPPSMGGGP